MVRRRRKGLSPLLLAALLVALWCMPLPARELPYGPEDYHISNVTDANSLGDDDDDDFNITAGRSWRALRVWLLLARSYLPV